MRTTQARSSSLQKKSQPRNDARKLASPPPPSSASRHRMPSNHTVSEMVTDVMEQTLTSTSRVIADWMRHGWDSTAVTAASLENPLIWIHDACWEPDDDDHQQQPEVIFVPLQPIAVPSTIKAAAIMREDDSELAVSKPSTQPSYYRHAVSGRHGDNVACCGGWSYSSLASSSSPHRQGLPTTVPEDEDQEFHPLPALETSSASSSSSEPSRPVEDTTTTTSNERRKPRLEFQLTSESTTHAGRATKNHRYQEDNHSVRSERTDYSAASHGTDLQSIHSFLMVSHAPKQPAYMMKQHHQQQQQYSLRNHLQQSYHTRVTTPIRSHLRQTRRCATPDQEQELEQDLVDFILTPSLMQQLQRSFPMLKRGDSFFLQYSLIRDGASLDTLLEKTQGTKHCVLAIETVEGEVFGAFLAQPLERSSQWTGSAESFLFAVEEKGGVLDSSLDNAPKIRVFKYSFLNPYVQLCQPDRLLIGSCDEGDDDEAGFGIALDGDLLSGTSNPCRTFASPSLSRFHANGSTFDVRNVEVWNLRPCLSIVEGQGQQVVHRRRRHRHCSRR